MKSIQEVKRSHEAGLLALPDVVSVGIGKDKDGHAAIIVGLSRQNPVTRKQIPETLDTYPVVVRVSGSVKAQ
jgi:hypothetical protein